MQISSVIGAEGKLSAVVIRKDGSQEIIGELKPTIFQKVRLWLKTHGLGAFFSFILILFGGLFSLPGVVFGNHGGRELYGHRFHQRTRFAAHRRISISRLRHGNNGGGDWRYCVANPGWNREGYGHPIESIGKRI
jgi:hypothetical protein